ncbi:serine/threonine-protein kinase [Kitasatospora aburaviensis]
MTAVSGALIGGRYQLLELIGQGGMGRVWRGQDTTLGRDVAVKEVLLPPGVGERERDELVQRVLREARAAARLNHPGIVTVHDVVEYEGAPVIVMEYITGMSLAAALARGGVLPVGRVADLGVAMVKALQRAHAAGIVHRDLKPDNVLLTDDRVVITDFGIAHMADATTALTRTGAVIGTPAYMAPEQLEGRPPTPANDLWSLGATLYAAVEEAPFSGATFGALCVAVVTKEPRPAVRAGVLAPVLAALLAKDPAHRATAEQVLAALDVVVRTGALPGVAGGAGTDADGAGGRVAAGRGGSRWRGAGRGGVGRGGDRRGGARRGRCGRAVPDGAGAGRAAGREPGFRRTGRSLGGCRERHARPAAVPGDAVSGSVVSGDAGSGNVVCGDVVPGGGIPRDVAPCARSRCARGRGARARGARPGRRFRPDRGRGCGGAVPRLRGTPLGDRRPAALEQPGGRAGRLRVHRPHGHLGARPPARPAPAPVAPRRGVGGHGGGRRRPVLPHQGRAPRLARRTEDRLRRAAVADRGEHADPGHRRLAALVGRPGQPPTFLS